MTTLQYRHTVIVIQSCDNVTRRYDNAAASQTGAAADDHIEQPPADNS